MKYLASIAFALCLISPALADEAEVTCPEGRSGAELTRAETIACLAEDLAEIQRIFDELEAERKKREQGK